MVAAASHAPPFVTAHPLKASRSTGSRTVKSPFGVKREPKADASFRSVQFFQRLTRSVQNFASAAPLKSAQPQPPQRRFFPSPVRVSPGREASPPLFHHSLCNSPTASTTLLQRTFAASNRRVTTSSPSRSVFIVKFKKRDLTKKVIGLNLMGLVHILAIESLSPSFIWVHIAQFQSLCFPRLCQFRDCTVDDSVCSPTPAVSPHLTATSGNLGIFRDGFNCSQNPLVGFFNVDFDFCVFYRTRVLGLQVKIFYGFLLSLATSIYLYALVMLSYQLTVEYLSGCNRLNPLGV